MKKIFLDYDCFSVLLGDVLHCIYHSGKEYDKKYIDSKIKFLIGEEKRFSSCSLDSLWRIVNQTTKNNIMNQLEERITEYVHHFSCSPIQFESESSAYLYMIFFFIIYTKNEITKKEKDESFLDSLIPHCFYEARQKLNHPFLFQQIMDNYNIDCNEHLFSLIEHEAGIDIYGVTLRDINNLVFHGVSNPFLTECMDSIIHMMFFDWPSENENKRLAVLFFAFVILLKDEMYDLFNETECDIHGMKRISKMMQNCFPSLCSNMKYYGYQIDRLIYGV